MDRFVSNNLLLVIGICLILLLLQKCMQREKCPEFSIYANQSEVMVGDTVEFTSSEVGDYSWLVGDTTYLGGEILVHRFEKAGDVSVSATKGECDCNDPISITVNARIIEKVDGKFSVRNKSGSNVYRVGDVLELNDRTSGVTKRTWFVNGSDKGGSKVVTYQLSESDFGSTTIKLVVDGSTFDEKISVKGKPQAAGNDRKPPCIGKAELSSKICQLKSASMAQRSKIRREIQTCLTNTACPVIVEDNRKELEWNAYYRQLTTNTEPNCCVKKVEYASNGKIKKILILGSGCETPQ